MPPSPSKGSWPHDYMGHPLDGFHEMVLTALLEGEVPESSAINDLFFHSRETQWEGLALFLCSDIIAIAREVSGKIIPIGRIRLRDRICQYVTNDDHANVIYDMLNRYPYVKTMIAPDQSPTSFSPGMPLPTTAEGWSSLVSDMTTVFAHTITPSPFTPYPYAHHSVQHDGVTAVGFLSSYQVDIKDKQSTVKWKEATFATSVQEILDKRRVRLAKEIIAADPHHVTEKSTTTALRAIGLSPEIVPGFYEHLESAFPSFGGEEGFSSALQSNLHQWTVFIRAVRKRYGILAGIVLVALILLIAIPPSWTALTAMIGVCGVLAVFAIVRLSLRVRICRKPVELYTIGVSKKFQRHYHPVSHKFAGEIRIEDDSKCP